MLSGTNPYLPIHIDLRNNTHSSWLGEPGYGNYGNYEYNNDGSYYDGYGNYNTATDTADMGTTDGQLPTKANKQCFEVHQ